MLHYDAASLCDVDWSCFFLIDVGLILNDCLIKLFIDYTVVVSRCYVLKWLWLKLFFLVPGCCQMSFMLILYFMLQKYAAVCWLCYCFTLMVSQMILTWRKTINYVVALPNAAVLFNYLLLWYYDIMSILGFKLSCFPRCVARQFLMLLHNFMLEIYLGVCSVILLLIHDARPCVARTQVWFLCCWIW